MKLQKQMTSRSIVTYNMHILIFYCNIIIAVKKTFKYHLYLYYYIKLN